MSGIEITGLVKQWGPTRAVDEVSFDVPEGSLTVLLGPSGCGKSTILRMIAGLESVSAGRVTIGGRDVTDLEPAERGVSMVFQSYALFPHLDVRENILFGLKVVYAGFPHRNASAGSRRQRRWSDWTRCWIANPRICPEASASESRLPGRSSQTSRSA